MDAFEVLYTARAMRRLRPDPVEPSTVARILDAAIRAPAPGPVGTQTWRFVTVTDRAVMGDLAAIWRDARDARLAQTPNLYGNERQAASSQYLHDHFHEVPLLVLGFGAKVTGAAAVLPALWSVCLAARAEGLGATFTTLLTGVADRVDRVVGVPKDAGVQLFGAVPIGHPRGAWRVAPRQAAHEVTYADRWGRAPTWRASGHAPGDEPAP
jgi:nitroreductase